MSGLLCGVYFHTIQSILKLLPRFETVTIHIEFPYYSVYFKARTGSSLTSSDCRNFHTIQSILKHCVDVEEEVPLGYFHTIQSILKPVDAQVVPEIVEDISILFSLF